MNKKLFFLVLSIWIVFSRAFDLFHTFKFSPDLSKESNILVSIFDFKWTALIFTITLLTFYVLYTFYKSLFSYPSPFPQKEGLGFKNFITYTLIGETGNLLDLFIKFPSLKRFNNLMGRILPLLFSYAGLITTIMWILIHQGNFYNDFYNPTFFYVLLIFGVLLIMIYWFFHYYNLYKKLDCKRSNY